MGCEVTQTEAEPLSPSGTGRGQEYGIGTWLARVFSMQSRLHLDVFDYLTAKHLPKKRAKWAGR